MDVQEPRRQGHVAATASDADAAVVHGHHSPSAPASGHGGERKGRRQEAVPAGGVVPVPRSADNVATGGGAREAAAATDGEAHHRRAPRVSGGNMEATDGSRKDRPVRPLHGAVALAPSPSTVTARPSSAISVGGNSTRNAAGGSLGSGANVHASTYQEATPPCLPDQPAARAQEEASGSAAAAALPEPDENELYRLGLEAAAKMDAATLRAEVFKFYGAEEQQRRQKSPAEREPMPKKRFSIRLPKEEAQADVTAIYTMMESASGNSQRRRR